MSSIEKLTGDYSRDRARIQDEHGHCYAVPGPFWNVEHVRDLHRRRGGHYFDDDSMRFFSGRVDGQLYAGRIFIDSVRYGDGERVYRASVLDLESRSVSRVRGLDAQPIDNRTKLDHVRRDVRALLESVGVNEWGHDSCPPCVARCAQIAEYLDTMPGWEKRTPTVEACTYQWFTCDAHASYRRGDGVRADIRVDESGMYATLHDADYLTRLDVRLPYVAGVYDYIDALGKAAWQVTLLAERMPGSVSYESHSGRVQDSSSTRETLDHSTGKDA